MYKSNIELPQLFGNFNKDRISRGISLLVSNNLFATILNNAKLVADLGSGLGHSTEALKEFCPGAEIHSVDVTFSELDAQLGENYTHFRMNFHEYLQQIIESGKKLDVVLMSLVPEHQLEKHGGYSLLSSSLVDGGLILELGDTGLDRELMGQYFMLVTDLGYSLYSVCMWEKK
jgi:trans-aconitate methyltransferase